MRRHLRSVLCTAACLTLLAVEGRSAPPDTPAWKAGVASVKITPEKAMWMAGYAARNRPAEGKETDLYGKALAIEENTGETFSFHETLYANADFVPDLQPADCDAHTRALADVWLALLNTNEFAYVY